MRRRRAQVCGWLPILALPVAGLVGSCGPARSPGEAQPLPQAEAFGDGQFDEIPVYPQSRPASEPTENGGVTTQSFTTRRAMPRELMDWYERELSRQGWDSRAAAALIGVNTYRGTWYKDDLQLTVSATYGPRAEIPSGPDRATQFSLVLRRTG